MFKTHERIRIFALFLFVLSVGGSAIWSYNSLILKNQFGMSNTVISVKRQCSCHKKYYYVQRKVIEI